MNRLTKIITAVTTIVTLSGNLSAQTFPVVLTQILSTAPATIVASSDFEITVVCDTANYVDVRTTAKLDEIDSIRFLEGKLTLADDGTRLILNDKFPYHQDIRVHTTAKNITLNASNYSKITLSAYNTNTIKINYLSINAIDEAMVVVEKDVDANQADLYVDKYGNIRHQKIIAPMVNRKIYGRGRINDMSKKDNQIEESSYAIFFEHDYREIPIFMDWNFGITTMGSTPFGGFNAPTSNFIWSSGMFFNYTGRYAFWQKDHWNLSTGVSVSVYNYRADNAYVDIVTDNATGNNSLSAIDASTLFATEEMTNGHILWNSQSTASYIGIPLRIEWRYRPDYKGIRSALELRPNFAIMRKQTYLIRNGFYENKSEVASTRNERFGKYLNPFRLDMRLSVTYNKIELFAETSLTPVLRTTTSHPDTKPIIEQKLYSFSSGICLTF